MSMIKSRKRPLGRSLMSDPWALTTVVASLSVAEMVHAASSPVTPAEPQVMQGVSVSENVDEGYKVDTVSSLKFTQPLQDIPQTIQVIPKELFNQQGATTLTEALRNSAGVGTFYAGENGSTSTGDAIYMRGFDTSNSIFADGIRDLGSISRDVFNIESVEVQKGPAGTDNGRSAPTGAVNTVSKQAFLEDAVAANLSGGIDGQKRATVDWNQTLGLAGSAVRLAAMWQDSDVPGREHVNNSRWGFAPTVGFGLGTDSRLHLSYYYVKQDNVPDGFVPTIGLPRWVPQTGLSHLVGNPVDPGNFYGTRADHDDSTARMATARFEHDFSGKLKLTNTTRWGLTQQDYLLSSFTVTGGTTANPMAGNVKWTNVNDLSTYTLNRSNNTFKDQSNRILTNQLNLRADFATGSLQHNLSTGLELTHEDQDVHTVVATGTRPAANLYDPNWNDAGTLTWARNGTGNEGKTDTTAVYLFDSVRFGERFVVTAGLRSDHYTTYYSSRALCTTAANSTAPCGSLPVGTVVQNVNLDGSGTLFNWKLGAVFKPFQALSLYANYALAQQPPGGSSFQLSSAANNANNPNLDPQKTHTVELGSKWSVLENRLALNVALFKTKVTNEINNLILDENNNPTQTGEKEVKGVELSVVGNITQNWMISASFSHLETEVVEGAFIAQDGTPNLTYTPGDTVSTWTSYRLPFGLTLGGGLRHIGGLHRGTDGAAGTPVSTGGYGVVDAVASWATNEKLSLRLNAYNVTDKRYVASINKSGYRYTPGAARSMVLSVDYRF